MEKIYCMIELDKINDSVVKISCDWKTTFGKKADKSLIMNSIDSLNTIKKEMKSFFEI